MRSRPHTDSFVIGFALFSMFFGAGNVIFPPYLGMSAGSDWTTGFLCYYMADIGLSLLALFSIFHRGNSNAIMRPIGRIPAAVFMSIIVLCIGPMLAIPRTAATTFEMSVAPLTGNVSSVVFSILFFGLVFGLTIRETAVVDIVGKVLTPLLLLGLMILIVKGVVTPLGDIAPVPHLTTSIAGAGIQAGYQTMDVLATVLFGVLILNSAEAKGYTEPKAKFRVSVQASLVAGVILFIIYGGLAYLGATVSTMYDLSIPRSALVFSIVSGLLGHKGTILFAVVVALACLTSAVGLVSSCAKYFSDLSGGKLSYSALATAICVFSGVACNIGLEQLVGIAGPILDLVYPPALVLIALSFFPTLPKLTYRLSAGGALVVSALTSATHFAGIEPPFRLPFFSLGFGWVVPAVLCGAVGLLISRRMPASSDNLPPFC